MSVYREDYADQVYTLCKLGATNVLIAEFFGVHENTVDQWMRNRPTFARAVKLGRIQADMEIAESLFNRARGYRWKEQQAIRVKRGKDQEDVVVVEVERQVPPDTNACIFWLKNRQRQEWQRSEQPLPMSAEEEDKALAIFSIPSANHKTAVEIDDMIEIEPRGTAD